jgi:hypothetical protein
VSSLGIQVLFVYEELRRLWRSTECIEIHGVSLVFCESRLNALIAFLKPGMLELSKTSQ